MERKKNVIIENEVVTLTNCRISGGDLPNGFEAFIDVSIDYNGVKHDDLLKTSAADRLIATARVLRKMTTASLKRFENEGLSLTFNECGKAILTPEEKREQRKRLVNSMTEEEKQALIQMLME